MREDKPLRQIQIAGHLFGVDDQVFHNLHQAMKYEIHEDATVTGTYTAHPDDNSMMEYLAGGTLSAIGRVRHEDYVPSAGKSGSSGSIQALRSEYVIQIDPAGNVDSLDILAMGLGGTTTVYASVTWGERY